MPNFAARNPERPSAEQAVAIARQVDAVMRAARAGQVDSATRQAAQLAEDYPRAADGPHLQALFALQRGAVAQALELARVAVERAPTRADARFTLGRCLKAGGAIDAAVDAYREALRLEPRLPETWVSLGIALRIQGRLDEAIAAQRTALKIMPGMAEAHANLAIALEQQRRVAEAGAPSSPRPSAQALAAQRDAARLNPDNPDILANLGLMLARSHEREEALHYFNLALARDPAREDICLALGKVFIEAGMARGAQAACTRWLELNAPTVDVLAALAHAHNLVGAHGQGLEAARQALAMDDTHLLAEEARAMALVQMLGHADLADSLARLDALRPPDTRVGSHMLMMMNYVEQDPLRLARLHRAGAGVAPPRPAARMAEQRGGDGRLRIAYLSGDLRRHSVAYFVEPLLTHHDRARFTVSCYSSNVGDDAVTARLKALADDWIDCRALTDVELAQRLHADGVDIAVDLAGHTADNRLGALAFRPAPLQLSHIGYPTITGMPGIDHRVSDRTIDPDGDAGDCNEESPLRLPHSMYCYRPDRSPEAGPLPLLAKGVITFGSFNNLAKVSAATVDLWAEVLRRVPGARLLLKASALADAATRASVHALFAARAIAPERIDMLGWTADVDSHLELYRRVDIALDTFPYNGATTTCEALWMGVPVISLAGATHASRMGASILGAAGCAEWVAATPAAYADLAVTLASQPAHLAAVRAALRERLRQSALMDERGYTAALEDLYASAFGRVVHG